MAASLLSINQGSQDYKMPGIGNIGFVLLLAGALVGCTTDRTGVRFLNPEQLAARTVAMEQALAQMDLNGDGIVTCSDSGIYRARRFDALDGNEDGKLTMAELRLADWFNVAFLEARFDHYDRDNSLMIERDEFINRPDPEFGEIDTNLDCVITIEELSESRPVRASIPQFIMRRRVQGGN